MHYIQRWYKWTHIFVMFYRWLRRYNIVTNDRTRQMAVWELIKKPCNKKCIGMVASPRPVSGELHHHIDGLEQDCSNSSALAMEILQSCTKASIWPWSEMVFRGTLYSDTYLEISCIFFSMKLQYHAAFETPLNIRCYLWLSGLFCKQIYHIYIYWDKPIDNYSTTLAPIMFILNWMWYL